MTSRSTMSAIWIALAGWWFLLWSTSYASPTTMIPFGVAHKSEIEIAANRTASSNKTAQRANHFLLGVTLDAAKHEFSIDWIQSFMSNIHKMGFRALHMTLPSDHRFARNASGLDTTDLTALATHARSLDNLTILPEISFHDATTWPIQPLPCPMYICSEERRIAMSGMNLPLDIRHSKIRSVVTTVLQNLVEGLGNPAVLHLGEWSASSTDYHDQDGCWNEVLATPSDQQKAPDYDQFESMIQEILTNDLGYQPRILRSKQVQESGKFSKTQSWEFQNYQNTTPSTQQQQQQVSYLLQPKQLDLSVSLLRDHSTGHDVYQETINVLQAYQKDYHDGLLEGIVVSTKGLPPQWFEDRNILGRLLAISMAVRDSINHHSSQQKSKGMVKSERETFEDAYREQCHNLFPQGNFCHRLGGLSIGEPKQDKTNERRYKNHYAKLWNDRALGICHNLTETREALKLRKPNEMQLIREQAFAAHWQDVGETFDSNTRTILETKKEVLYPRLFHKVFGQSNIPFRGFFIDLVDDPSSIEIRELMEEIMVPLGLNTLQVSLMNHLEPLLRDESQKEFDNLRQIAAEGDRLGIEIIPEISITTQAAAWYPAGFLVDCPNTMCSANGGTMAAATQDVNHGSLLPLVLAVIRRIRRIFSSGSFLHLGSDERSLSEACWKESGKTPHYDRFERALSGLVERKNWYRASNILRWENVEGTVYPDRAGKVTQYRYENGSLPSIEDNHYVFGSISIPLEKEPWAVYQETRRWVHSSGGNPTRGLVAGIQWNRKHFDNHQYMSSILAFAVGLSTSAPILQDSSSLDSYLSDVLCVAKNQKSRPCPSPSSDDQVARIRPNSAQLRAQMICNSMTHVISRNVMRSQTSSQVKSLRSDDDSNK